MVKPEANTERLNQAIDEARRLTVCADYARLRAEELTRWGQVSVALSVTRRWTWTAFVGVGAVCLVLLLVVARYPANRETASFVGDRLDVGGRVSIVASDDADYAIALSVDQRTEIEVRAGAVTARLYPGNDEHRLVLRAKELEVVATGTIYTVSVDALGHAHTIVHEGQVEAFDGQTTRTVKAGASWPVEPNEVNVFYAEAFHVLRDYRRPLPEEQSWQRVVDAGPRFDASMKSQSPGDAQTRDPSHRDNLVTIWRRARLLRGQGRYRQSLELLDELIATKDSIWAPIAHVEAMRIQSRVLTKPKSVIRLGEQFFEGYPKHELAVEATELYCRAYEQIGKKPPAAVCTSSN